MPNELSTKGELEKLSPEDVLQAKENIAELVLDKMVQLDHGNMLHKNMKTLTRSSSRHRQRNLARAPNSML